MARQIAILRGINVGGRRKILMADLRELFIKLGFKNIVTYIQSGNVIFDSEGSENNSETSRKVEQAILKNFKFEVPVIIRNADVLNDAIANNPFFDNKECDIERLYLTFLKEVPRKENLEKISEYDFSPDKFEIIEDNIFGYSAGSYSESKLTNNFFETKLQVSATTRNWKTVLKLSELSV